MIFPRTVSIGTTVCVRKMDEFENTNFSFKNKSSVDALLQKGLVEEHATEGLRSNNVTHKDNLSNEIKKGIYQIK